MENTLLIALSRQMVMQRQLEVIANNIANTSTSGYKGEQMMFVEYLAKTETGETVSYVQDIAVIRDYSEGPLLKTGNTFDLAIHGKGWFVIDTPNGPAYTRNGTFSLNAKGELSTSQGYPVLNDSNSPIVIGASGVGIEISADGTISTPEGSKGRLNIVAFEDEALMDKASNSLYLTDQPTKPAIEARIQQGMLENSNIQPIIEVSNMIVALRSYQSAQEIIKGEDGILREAIKILTETQA
jgi:flagellar basal-body rod protein FlgF